MRFILISLFTVMFGSIAGADTVGATSTNVGTPIVMSPTIGTTSSINPAAQQGKSSQSGGSSMNMMAGMALMAACMAMQPPNMALCMMGAMAMAQGGADKDAASQSGATQAATSTPTLNTGGTGTTGTTATTTANTASIPTFAAIDDTSASLKDKAIAKEGLQALTNAGYSASAAGIKSANGTTIPAAAFSSSGGMIAAGLDPNQVKDAQDAAAKVNADLAKYKGQAAVAEGVGGGGGSGPTGESQSTSTPEPHKTGFANPFAMTDGQKSAMIAGKTVSFDGEPIGVRGDNIFDMVHTAYARKTAGKHFIETDHDPDLNTVRAPASLPKALPTLNPSPRK